LRARRSRGPLEHAVEVATRPKPRTESSRLGKHNLLIVWRRGSADRTCLRWVLRSVYRLAPPAESDRQGWTKRVWLLHHCASLRLIVDDTNRRVDDAVFHSLGRRSKLTDRNVELAIDDSIGGPFVGPSRRLVEEVANTRWESEHRQHPDVRKALAQR